ncbi:MAG TPA: hypothetical protein VFA65_09255 [Bryobacteraceae bacterium]|nr:hypothetical protein [Bryobacteraceae bacterium]
MYEDSTIELEACTPLSRVFCICSAGCTARALSAARHDVTAVDINSHQVLYAQARASGAPVRDGAVEQLLAGARVFLPLVGWTQPRLRAFLSMHDSAEQHEYWQSSLNSRRWRIAFDSLLSAVVLGLVYARPFARSMPRRFGSVIRARFERAWRDHPNAGNPYAWRLLMGKGPSMADPSAHKIRFVCADAASYLETCKPESFDAFSLSNIADGASPSYKERLYRAVKRAAAPSAVVIARSIVELPIRNNLAARDRSILWGTVQVTRAEDLCSTF